MKNSSTAALDRSKVNLGSSRRHPLLVFPSALILSFAVCRFEMPAMAQEPADKPAAPTLIVRQCPAPAARKNKTRAKSAAKMEEFASACLEAKGSPLEFQEFFQSYVRAQSWQISDEKIVEDGWIFSRSLTKDELLQCAKEGLFAGRVKWTEGKALVQVRTRELDGGFSRVEIIARFQGGGENVDRFAPPRDSWDLESNGALEKILIAALDAHVKSLH